VKVRSAYVRAPWRVELRQVELPDEPPAGWVLLRVAACGICGTDLTAAAEKAADWHPVGHEIAGVIERLGHGVKGLAAGQAVALESASFCGRCELCRDGRVDLCAKAPNFWSQPAMGFSDAMHVPADCCVPYEGLSPEAACQAEPGGVAYDMVRTADVQMGDRVCLVGPGPIGLAAVALARHRGASRLLCVGRASNGRRLALAGELGAETLATDAPLDSLADLKRRFDHVLVTAPTGCLVPAMALLAYGGVLTYIGIGTGDATVRFDANEFHFRKLQLRASFASPAIYFPAVLRLMRGGVMPAESLVSHTFPLERIAEAFALCRDRKQETVKVIIKP